VKVKTWTTREGDVLQIREMETQHILNCLAMLERTAALRKRRAELEMTLSPFQPQGDMATDAFNYEFDELLSTQPLKWARRQPQYRALLKELIRRIRKGIS
jgi:hypothetical protein